jgi:DNA (cytosine-5)-methyltransferase 1
MMTGTGFMTNVNEVSHGSLCTGYDGLGMALALAGVPVVPRWMAEVDPAVSKVLAIEHPDVRNVGDIKAAPWRLAPHVDLMSSGDPCQGISIAGRQLGRADPRFLWPWVREAYRTVRPGGIFFENVSNIVSHDGGRTLAERHEHLREDGYAVRWTVLGACAVGAPHHRHRYYAVAGLWTGSGPVPEAVRLGGKKAICGAPRSGGRFLLPSPMARDGDGRGEGDPSYWRERLARRGRTNGMPLGAAINLLPSPRAADAGRYGVETDRSARTRTGGTLHDAIGSLPLLPTPRASDGEKGRGNPGQVYGSGTLPLSGAVALLPTPTTSNSHGNKVNNRGELLLPGITARPEVWGKFAEAVALWESITGVVAPDPTEPGKNGGRRLNPLLPEWMMGLRPGLLTGPLGRADALKAAGNGVVALAAAAAWRMLTARSE